MATRSTLAFGAFMVAAACLMLSCSGCVYGIIYTDVTEPLSTNMHETKNAPRAATGELKEVKEPLTLGGVRVTWSTNAIGDIAKAANMKRLQFADVRTQSYLAGIWTRKTVIVHGE